MTTYLPIIVSLMSILIAATALGWNIYRDVFSKARVKTWASRTVVKMVDRPSRGPFLDIEAKNFGPGAVKIDMIVFRNPWRLLHPFDKSGGVILFDWENPLSGKLPVKLEPGDKVDLFLSWSDQDKNCVFNHPFGRLGVRDSFDRNHWVPKKQIRHLRRKFAEEFPRAAQRS